MRRHRVLKRLRGQLLFIEADAEGVTIDSLLATSDGNAVLVTLSFSVAPIALPKVLHVLSAWEQRSVAVTVLIGDGRQGPEVEMSSGAERLILTGRD